ncbi:hypothetical protein MPSEU_000120800 [Mayamaea pseudoterrestris]|nr:hypothetical protein MPSEU_000120800 [Mayamaea pseudoterrestris]
MPPRAGAMAALSSQGGAHSSLSSASSSTSSHNNHHRPLTPLRRYVSRRVFQTPLPNMPTPDDYVGFASGWALIWFMVHLVVPGCYAYIFLVLLRYATQLEALRDSYMQRNVGPIVSVILRLDDDATTTKGKLRVAIETWCWLEAVWYVCMKIHLVWLQRKDPLEACLSAAPLMELKDRALLWKRMMEEVSSDPVSFLCGWFFDSQLEDISNYDIRDFIAWSMFEGRHQEHLTSEELDQLETFLAEAEYRLSLYLHGEALDGDDDEHDNEHANEEADANGDAVEIGRLQAEEPEWRRNLPKPKKMFRFAHAGDVQEPSFFSDFYEAYKTRYDQMMSMAPEFHPIQDLKEMVSDFDPAAKMKTVMAEAKQTIVGAEETAIATANQVYETVVTPGSSIDKQLTAMSHATRAQLFDAWNSVVTIKASMRERLEQARLFSKQRQRLTQQLKGYKIMLKRMREMSSAVPARQMSMMMRRITECNESLELLEQKAQAAFEQATGYARKNLPFLQHREPRRFAKYSSDPLLGIVTYPLWFCVTLNVATEVPLRIMLHRRGFERRSIGPVSYYMHPGKRALGEEVYSGATYDNNDADASDIPIIFVHGIGVGLIAYVPLIDALLATGRPVLLPEIPYVSAFRPLQSPDAVLSPATVASTMNAMLATHGYMSGTWIGHSYGTSWLSYMIKFASHAVSAVLFLDPICFCLHQPRLTKAFVYLPPDLGQLAYFVRADAIVNWTVQRSFPWAWISLFLDQIDVPCSVFLSERDTLVPAAQVESYFRRNNVPVTDFAQLDETFLTQDAPCHCVLFRGDGHGDWTERPTETVPQIVAAVEVLCRKAEVLQQVKRE